MLISICNTMFELVRVLARIRSMRGMFDYQAGRAMKRSTTAMYVILAVSLPLENAFADTYCVATVAELKSAIQTAYLAEETTTEIKVRSGFYDLGASGPIDIAFDNGIVLGGTGVAAPSESIRISGGWVNCDTQVASTNLAATQISGSSTGIDLFRVFLNPYLNYVDVTNTRHSLTIENINFLNGGSTNGTAACVNVIRVPPDANATQYSEHDVRLSRLQVDGCSGVGVNARGLTNLEIVNSLFKNNDTAVNVSLPSTGSAFIVNNTFRANSSNVTGSGGIVLSADEAIGLSLVVNNIFAEQNFPGQYSADVVVSGQNVIIRNNSLSDIEVLSPGTPPIVLNNANILPSFVSASDSRLQANSLLRDIGFSGALVNELIGPLDRDAKQRVQGDAPEYGAFELMPTIQPLPDPLFANSFD